MQVETFHYDFYKDSKTSPNEDPQSNLDKCIYSIVKKEGYISCNVNKKTIAADGGNYLGTLLEVDVKGKTVEGYKKTDIFIKCIAPDSTLDIISLPGVYQMELFMYNEISKIFEKLQNEYNVPDVERYKTVKCFEESNNEAIIMENVTKKGFKTWYRMDIVTLDMAEECIKQLAKFHGLSFVMKERMPDYFNSKIKTLKTPYIFGNTWSLFVDKTMKMDLNYLDENLKRKIEGKLPYILKKLQEYYTDENITYCLCHGDYRPNNVMVKEENGKVTEVIPVDFQLMYYGCPVVDFLYFIYISTDRQFRRSHLVYLKNLYYSSLDQFLQHFDLSAESVFPRKIYESLYEEKLDYGLAISFLLGPFLFVSEDGEVPDVMNGGLLDLDLKIDGRFKDRLQDAVEEFIDLGYF